MKAILHKLGGRGPVRSTIKGILFAAAITMTLVLLWAIVVRFAGIGGVTLNIVNQAIKVISIFIGVGITLRGVQKRGWLFGGLMGLLYAVFIFLLFSIINTNFEITTGLLYDMLFGVAFGVISVFLVKIVRRPQY